MKTVLMFSGQGSQYFQMGRELFDSDSVFREWMIRLNNIVQDISGASVIEALYSSERGKSEAFERTSLTHPAIFMVEYSLAKSLAHVGVMPDVVLGASLGSFAAAAVAGFVDVEDALAAVIEQATVLDTCCEPGGMLAVLADPALFAEDFLGKHSELAGINFSSHFVIAARRIECAQIEAGLKQRNVTYQRLPVACAFHSQWIDAARASFEAFARSIRVRRGHLPLACCDRAEILSELPEGYFWSVVRRPIRFRETTARLERAAGEQQSAYRYIDVGPGGTLATFLKYGLPAASRSTTHAILTPFGRDRKNLAALAALAAPHSP